MIEALKFLIHCLNSDQIYDIQYLWRKEKW